MNYVIVRTKLQALIVLELLRRGVISRPFVFVPLYQLRVGEDSDAVQTLYDAISVQASRVYPIVQSAGLLRACVYLWFAGLKCLSTRGTIFAAVLNYYPLAVALRLLPGVDFCSFDDGTANIEVRDTSYHSMQPLPPGGWKRVLARALFPVGSSAYCRSRIRAHYTIYAGLANIVSPQKTVPVHIRWADLLSRADKARIPHPIRTLLLGTVYDEIDREKWRSPLDWALQRADLYLPHPRQKKAVDESMAGTNLDATAEAVINYLLQEDPGELTVYHFGSSVALSFLGTERVRFVDLFDPAQAEAEASHAAQA